jgi:uncharacterized lipoprotein
MKPFSYRALALLLLLPLAACSQAPDSQPASTGQSTSTSKEGETAPRSLIAKGIDKAMQEAKRDLATKNIELDHVHFGNDDNDKRPKAEITPQGDLLIAGKKVDATPAQRTLLLDYRQQIVDIASAGMDIGTQGADLGMQAAKTAMLGAFSGKSDKQIEAALKPQTDKIEAAAHQLCQQHMPAMLASQQKLAAAMTAFQPYATMEQKDIDDCSKDMTDQDGKHGFAVFSD